MTKKGAEIDVSKLLSIASSIQNKKMMAVQKFSFDSLEPWL